MANWNDPQPTKTGFGASPSLNGEVLGTGATYDAGLRKHMLAIYNYMASGVLLSGIVALLFASSGMAAQVLSTPLKWVIMLAPLGFVFAMSLGANRMATSTLQALFWGFCAVMGLSLSSIFLVFTASSIASTFFATAGAFAGLSLYGYTTKKSLSGMGSFMVMGLIGILIAMLINLFLQSSALQLAISILGVVIFAGLTAWDTQRLKQEYYMLQGTEFAGKAVVLGALTLYLDFINMFQFLLSFLGNRD
ncbi:MAG: Bax inhibitor-1/YccA family protein [Novosphingobium sp.]|jgi:FtsH-binding integral membrane protein